MNRLLVIGGESIDVLHLEDRSVTSAGGAGVYTAMAARRCGAHVSMFSPRPEPCPALLQPVAMKLKDWPGPAIPPAQVPRYEISYQGGKTEYLQAYHGAEATLSPAMLPADLSTYDLIHVIPVENPVRQLSFIQACRQRGATQISGGTWPTDAAESTQAVRAVMEECDLFFMNEYEAAAIFGSLDAACTAPGKVLFVTLGPQGVYVIQGETSTWIPAVPATELDPTGAGDTFCGATLAHLLQKRHPIMAARRAASLAAEMIGHVGPTALLSDEPPPEAPADGRVRVNAERVRKVAGKISTLADLPGFQFVSPELPPVGHPKTLDYFFAATLQQFSFWTVQDDHYDRPLIAKIGGAEKKGSDYLWEAIWRRVKQDADFCSPQRQANLAREELLEVFRSDDGQDPMPALDLHLAQARSYGRDMLALQLTPLTLLQNALSSDQPLEIFLVLLDKIGGYKEDPLRKKSCLLALILSQRPEHFLPLRDDEKVPPIIDYHLMRSCLRIGLIDVLDKELYDKLLNRQLVSAAEDWAVRRPAYRAMEQVHAHAGRSISAVNTFFFGARKRCPEMSEPECQSCQVDSVCAHRKELFQPVLRTTFY